MRLWRAGIAAALLLALAGCGDEKGAMQAVGSGVGAAVGAVLGSQVGSGVGRTIATAGGAALGGYAGGRLFARLAEADRERAEQAQYEALEYAPSGQPVHWSNPDTGSTGQVTAQPAFEANHNAPCRKFTHVVDSRDDGVMQASGTACRQPDGRWKVVAGD